MKNVTVKPFTATGSNVTTEINPEEWENPQDFIQYMVEYAAGVILQRASAGKADDPEKAEKAIKTAIDRLQKGIPAAGGGFSRLSPEDYALKEALIASKVKFEKGESVEKALNRIATKLQAGVNDLKAELEATEVYKTALKARKSKAKANVKEGSLLSKL